MEEREIVCCTAASVGSEVHLHSWKRCTWPQFCCRNVIFLLPFSSVSSVSHVRLKVFSLLWIRCRARVQSGQGNLVGGDHWNSVSSASSQCSLSSVFLDELRLLSAISSLFFFFGACPIDSGSRRRANRLEKHSLSRPRHISLHHSHSSEKRKVSPVPSSLLSPLPIFTP